MRRLPSPYKLWTLSPLGYRDGPFSPTHPPGMDSQHAALAICGATAAYVWYRWYRTSSIGDVPGPKNPSWIYGISTSQQGRDIISQIPEQDINGGGILKKRVSLRRTFSTNTEQSLAGTEYLGYTSRHARNNICPNAAI